MAKHMRSGKGERYREEETSRGYEEQPRKQQYREQPEEYALRHEVRTPRPEERAPRPRQYEEAPRRMPSKRKRHTGRRVIIALLVAAVIIGGMVALKIFVVDNGSLSGLFGLEQEESSSQTPSEASQVVSALTSEPIAAPTPEPTPESTPSPTPEPTPPSIPDDGTNGYLNEGIYIWNNKAFELFYGSTNAAQYYASAISGYRDYFGENVRVYDMVVPNHSEFGLPERIRDSMGCTSQRENLTDVYSALTNGVQAVDIYDNLNLHNDEYIYFNTDTHWAPLGAYYAYETFCQVSGAEVYSLDTFTKTTVEDFTGYLAWLTGENCLYENPDYIDLYVPSCSFTPSLSYDGYSFSDLDSLHGSNPDAGYSMVIYGDTPLFRIINHDGQTGRKLLMVKDSYGNALAPFLIPSFDEVHVADFRSFPRNLPAYCAENGITDVLFFNNVMSANTYSQVDTMSELFQ